MFVPIPHRKPSNLLLPNNLESFNDSLYRGIAALVFAIIAVGPWLSLPQARPECRYSEEEEGMSFVEFVIWFG